MPDAIRLTTDMGGWLPVTRHYEVPGGYLAVTCIDYLTQTGTHIYYCDESGGAISTTPLVELAEGTTYEQALESLGYTVIDTVTETIEPAASPAATAEAEAEPSVFDILPPEIAAMIPTPPQESSA